MKTTSNIMLGGYIFLVANMITEITTSLPTGSSSFTTTRTTATTPTTTLTPTSSTTTTTTTTITTTTTTTSKSNQYPGQVNCPNGGIFDGYKCICLDMFFGPLCESIENSVHVGRTTDLTVNVVHSIVNVEFIAELSDTFSNEYKDFVKDHQLMMMELFRDLPGFKDTIVLSLRQGSVIVDYSVIVEAAYDEHMSIVSQYDVIFDHVVQALQKFAQKTCNENATFCIDVHSIYTSPHYPLSEHG
uniref:SEA domain-containing protein n=1 Tax=Leptobrachium leishanense TaxID=445787 RepID=A0A8C5QM05_9ANUR